MTHPALNGDGDDDRRGLWTLRIVVLALGLLVVVSLTQTATSAVDAIAGLMATEEKIAEVVPEPDEDAIRQASRKVHLDCSSARPSLGDWVGGYVDKILPAANRRSDGDVNCARCGKPLER